MKLHDLLKGIDILEVSGEISGDVSSICYDSRKCEDGCLFIAVTGLKLDGHDFIEEAVKRGAKYIVCEKEVSHKPGVTFIRVSNSRKVCGELAVNFYRDPSSEICLIGITGTNGKTTVSYLLESILKTAGFSVGVIGTVNCRYGKKVLESLNTTPEALDLQRLLRGMADVGITHVVMEVSSHAIDLGRVEGCKFDAKIFTNLSPEHLDYHRNMESYFLAKKKFFEKTPDKTGMIINIDDTWGVRLVHEIRRPVATFGINTPAEISADNAVFSMDGINANIKTPKGVFPVSSLLVGKFNLYNIMAAAAASLAVSISEEYIQDGIRRLRRIPGRLEKVNGHGEPSVLVDYAHTEDALRNVLEDLSHFKEGKIITVFGCGGDRDRTKRPLMGKTASELSDIAIITSDNPRTENPLDIISEMEAGIAAGAVRKYLIGDITENSNEKGYVIVPDRRAAIELAISIANTSDIVLIAGKGHENYQIVKDTKMAFDDREIAREVLARRDYGGIRIKRLSCFSAEDIAAATSGTIAAGKPTAIFRGVSTDSRNVMPGNLFIPLKGEKFDGHDFIRIAVEKGASGVLIQKGMEKAAKIVPDGISVVIVDNTLTALGDIAHFWRKKFEVPVVAVTGSSGKTTTKEMIASIASLSRKTLKSQGNFNNLVGLPLTLLEMRDDYKVVVLEMGSNTKGEIRRLAEIALPDVGVITNIGSAHLGGFGSLEAVKEEKGSLFRHMRIDGVAIVNMDDDAVRDLAGRWSGRSITFGKDAFVFAEDIAEKRGKGTDFTLGVGEIKRRVRMTTLGDCNIQNALAAAASCWSLGIGCDIICEGLETFRQPPGRMNVSRLKNGAYLIDDTYNANPESTGKALEMLAEFKGDCKSAVIFGDMLELGDTEEEIHEKIGKLMSSTRVGRIFLRGDLVRAVAAGAEKSGMKKDHIFLRETPEEVAGYLEGWLGEGDCVIVKGSRRMKMEEFVFAIKEKSGEVDD